VSEKQLADAEHHERNAVDYERRSEITEGMIERYGANAKWQRMAKADRARATKSRESARRLRIMDRLNVRYWRDVSTEERNG
jgi:hypothetical protein